MKNILSIFLFLFSSTLFAQTTEVAIEKVDEETVAVMTTTLDAEGRTEKVEYEYLSTADFASYSLNENNQKLVNIDQQNEAIIQETRDVTQLRKFVIDSLDIAYDSLKTRTFSIVLIGDANLIERGGATTSLEFRENNNPNNIRIVEQDSPGRSGTVVWTHSGKFEIRNFFTENIVFTQLTGTSWRGKHSDGTVYIIRKQ